MQTREIKNLIVENGDCIIYGDAEISGDVIIRNNCSLIVSGKLTFTDSSSITTIDGSISAGSISINIVASKFYIYGDIYVATDLSPSTAIISTGDIFVGWNLLSWGDIECNTLSVGGNLDCSNITVDTDVIVEGNIDSCSIFADKDIYIGGYVDSFSLKGRDIFIGGEANLHYCSIHAWSSLYIHGDLESCSQIIVGK